MTPTFGLLDIIKYVKTNLKEMVFEDFESEKRIPWDLQGVRVHRVEQSPDQDQHQLLAPQNTQVVYWHPHLRHCRRLHTNKHYFQQGAGAKYIRVRNYACIV